jgi:hypothetical protein
VDLPKNEPAASSSSKKLLARLSGWYTQGAILLANTLLLLLLVTLFSYAYYALRWRHPAPVYSSFLRPQALHRMSADQAARFFKEFDRMGEAETFIFQPWVAFSERVFHSEKLNVDVASPLPLRRTRNVSGRSGPPLVIWAFGGSTMFGWGVPDDQTIASHLANALSRALPQRSVSVINHGHAFFFSSQELALFEMLLRRGEKCDVAVFLDGLNDAFQYGREDIPAFTDRMRAAFEKDSLRTPLRHHISGFPPNSRP